MKIIYIYFVTAAAFLPLPRPNKNCTTKLHNDHIHLHHAIRFGDGLATISVAVAGYPGDNIVVVIGNHNNTDDDDSHGLHYHY